MASIRRIKSAYRGAREKLLQKISHRLIRGGAGCFVIFGDRGAAELFAPIYLDQGQPIRSRRSINRAGLERAALARAASHGLVVFNGIDPPKHLAGECLRMGWISPAVHLCGSQREFLAALGSSARDDLRRARIAGYQTEIHRELDWAREFHQRYHTPAMLLRHGDVAHLMPLGEMEYLLRERGAEFVCLRQKDRRVAAALCLRDKSDYRMLRIGWRGGDLAIHRNGVIGAIYAACIDRARQWGARHMTPGSTPQYLEHGLTGYKLKWNATLEPSTEQPGCMHLLMEPGHARVQWMFSGHSLILLAPGGGHLVLSGRSPGQVKGADRALSGLKAWFRLLPEPVQRREHAGHETGLLPERWRRWVKAEQV